VTDPLALRFGFQLTARVASEPSKQAGTFTPNVDGRVYCAPDGNPGPCSGAIEYVTHTPTSAAPGGGGQRTFVLEWTPPGRDLGEVIFYAAAIGANNDGTENGDYVYTASRRAASAGCNMTERPSIRPFGIGPRGGIVDAASFRNSISSNALITIFGGPFAPSTRSYRLVGSDLVNGRLPPDLACIAVEFPDGKRAPAFYVQADQINAQAPILDGTGPISVTVIANPGTANELRSAPGSAQVGTFAPALFTFNGRSVAALNASNNNRIVADPSVVSTGAPARPGDIVILYGTGFGLTAPVFQAGEFSTGAPRLQNPVSITIGGITLSDADVFYAGLSPDAPGFYQFNVRLPGSLPDGDIPVTIRIGGVSTQSAAIIPIRR
jgi:uncharacterized protein (TIGR03437 family)